MDFNGREAFVTTIESTKQDVTEAPIALSAFKRALAALSAANHDLDSALNKPDAAQKAQAVQISEQRILHALGSVASAISAWKGI